MVSDQAGGFGCYGDASKNVYSFEFFWTEPNKIRLKNVLVALLILLRLTVCLELLQTCQMEPVQVECSRHTVVVNTQVFPLKRQLSVCGPFFEFWAVTASEQIQI